MAHDAALPPGIRPPAVAAMEAHGVLYAAARWTPDVLARLSAQLESEGRRALAKLGTTRLLDVWCDTVAAFRTPDSPERRALAGVLPRFCRLSPAGLAAGLEAVLGGVSRRPAEELMARSGGPPGGGSVLVILASTLPALAVQPLLPALALRLPVILKSPSSEPLFAPAFVAALGRREPILARALAAVTWPGGDRGLEDPLLSGAGRVIAYGEVGRIADLKERAAGKVFGYGPRSSLAVVGRGIAAAEVASGLARDVALFDQRGCLSIQAVYTMGEAGALAAALATELQRLAVEWPPGPADPVVTAGVQQIRVEARMRGLFQPPLPLAAGTVVVEPESSFRPSPGGRTVRIHPLPGAVRLPEILAPWAGRLQGAALAGEEAWRLRPALEELGISRCAPPGELRSPDALWHDGGIHPFEILRGVDTE